MRRHPRRAVPVAAALALALSACGSSDEPAADAGSDDAAEETAAEETEEASATEEAASDDPVSEDSASEPASSDAGDAPVGEADTSLGTVLVDVDGKTLYGFTPDEGGGSACTGGCLDTWPPLTLSSDEVPDGLDPDLYGVLTREDGTFQLTAGGWPLYTYAPDAPGDVSGQGVGDSWFAMAPDGTLIREADGGGSGGGGEEESSDARGY